MKAKTRLIKLRKENPLLTGSAIGRMIGLSRQYVSRILQQEGLHNVQPTYKRKVVLCKICGKRTPRGQMLCPVGECKDLYYNVEVTCSFCQYKFILKRGQINQQWRIGSKNIYCSRACVNKGRRDGII